MRETKVNLKHLLEDIRDSYAMPMEEVILIELIANSLDSGANKIYFLTEPQTNTLTIIDNGKGMKRQALSDYHNIAATTKTRGRGIGFAGVGAKLSLLLAKAVITESKGGYGSRCATEWYLKNETSAPWKFAPVSGKIATPRGTAVSIVFNQANLPLLDDAFITQTALKNFYPLFVEKVFQPVLKYFYKKGVKFFVNNNKIILPKIETTTEKTFQIKLSGSRQLAGSGYLFKPKVTNQFLPNGLNISTFGKVIKSGWEWIGLLPQNVSEICGVVEIPALAGILTTNKMDFLKDATSLKKYYQYRKAIQEAVLPILEEFGESITAPSKQKEFKSLARDIESALKNMLDNFPELVPLLGIKKLAKAQAGFSSQKEPLVGIVSAVAKPEDDLEKKTKLASHGAEDNQSLADKSLGKAKKKSKKGPALSIGFETRTSQDPISRMVENKIWLNALHPAYLKAKAEKQEPYHILFSVAWALSFFLEQDKSPQDFINDFLSSWGCEQKHTTSLLQI